VSEKVKNLNFFPETVFSPPTDSMDTKIAVFTAYTKFLARGQNNFAQFPEMMKSYEDFPKKKIFPIFILCTLKMQF